MALDLMKRASERFAAAMSGKKLPEETPYDQGQDDIQIASMVRQYVEECRSHPGRVANEAIWMTNIAYVIGFDSVHYDTDLRVFRPLGSNDFLFKDRVHVNKIISKSQNRLARLCKNPPKYDVRPSSEEQEDKDAADLGLKIIQYYWDKEKLNDKRIDVKNWCQQAGIGYFHVCFDTTTGKMVMNPETGELEREGDISIDIASPFECFPDPQAKRFSECQKFARCKIRPLDYFQIHYPERGHLVKEESCWINSLAYDMAINFSTNATGNTTSVDRVMKNSAIEIAYYEAPSKNHPQGRFCIVANGVVLKKGVLPAAEAYTDEPAKIPYVKFDDIRVAGKFTSEAVVTHARPIQDQLNRTLHQRARWVNRLLAGKYVAPRGANIQSDAMNDQSGEVVTYTVVPNAAGGGEPHALDIPNIPQYAYLEEERLNMALDETFGINEVSSGQLPSAGIPAIGMQFLVEQDDTRIGIMTESDEQAYAMLGKHILKFAQAYIKTDRIMKFSGQNRGYVVKKWRGDLLKGNDDVIVIRGSTLPGSKVLNRQEVLNLFNQGLLGDPADPRVREKVLGQLQYGDVAESWQDLALDMHQINEGLAQIEQGIKPVVDEQDNHALWVQELNRARKGTKFQTMSEDSQILLLQVREEHLNWLVKLKYPNLEKPEDMPEQSDSAAQLASETGLPVEEPGMAVEAGQENFNEAGLNLGTEEEQIPPGAI